MDKQCIGCKKQDDCFKFDSVDANKCEEYIPIEHYSSREEMIIESIRQESIMRLKREVPHYTDIENLIGYLKSKSEISFRGKMNPETTVNKEALTLAAIYLQDYLDLMDYHARQTSADYKDYIEDKETE